MSMIDKSSVYFRQAELLLRVLPFLEQEPCFALKGGTAINYFIRDLPRLSVDIDLTYVHIEPRDETLLNIGDALDRLAQLIEERIRGVKVQKQWIKGHTLTSKLIIHHHSVQIKIEPNLVLRGSVFPTERRPLTRRAVGLFGVAAKTSLMSFADIYGGKLCACLDRQHPRDIYDVKILLENEGLSDEVRKAFLVYLISTDRPIHELLSPNLIDFRDMYRKELTGMTIDKIEYEALVIARQKCIDTLHDCLTNEDKEFLLSVKLAEPDWHLVGLPGVESLPGVKWKLMNIKRMDKQKQKNQFNALKQALGLK